MGRVKDELLSGKVSEECTCWYECDRERHTSRWHQHEDDKCPVHPDAQMIRETAVKRPR